MITAAPSPLDSKTSLPFTGPWLLAPMEGVTDSAFRSLVLKRSDPRQLGGAFSEFMRVVDLPRRPAEIRRHLGSDVFETPVGVQLMGSDLASLAASARNAVVAGAPFVDLNFGCPAKGALRHCAGAALLREPQQLERIVGACVREVAGQIPVTAKIRAGFDRADRVEDLARAVEAGGASLLTVHCRTKAEKYSPDVDWSRIERAVASVQIPVCGNGGVASHRHLMEMRAVTGCSYVMVGHGAMFDPWIFSGRAATRHEAATFLLEYYDAMRFHGANPRNAAGRTKQLLRGWRVGGVVQDERDRRSWLREADPSALVRRLSELAPMGGMQAEGASALCLMTPAE